MQIASYKKKTKTAPLDTPNKNRTQQEKRPLMSFKNNGTIQKWHITNTAPKIDKCDAHKKMVPYTNDTPCKKMPKGHMPRVELSDFLKGILKFVVWFRPMVIGF